MSIEIDQYFINVINSAQWYEIKKRLEYQSSIITIPISLLKDFKNITQSDLYTLSSSIKRRVVLDTNETKISSNSNQSFIKIIGNVNLIHKVSPYPIKINLQCKGCKSKFIEEINIPISPPNPEKLLCGQSRCHHYIQNRPFNSYQIDFINAFKFNLDHNNSTINCYVIENPIYGFNDVVEKIKCGYKLGSELLIYGFCQIQWINGNAEYFIEVQDVEIKEPKTKKTLIPYISIEEPTNEKEMVMGSFFCNLEYMRRFLDFETYELQKKYPDLVLRTKNGTKIVEFEYDVANFYHHKHHTQEPKCDLIIAWTCTTQRIDFPYLLLSSLKGTYVSDKNIWNDPSSMLQNLINVVAFHYPEVCYQDIPLLLIPIIDSNIPIHSIDSISFSINYSIPIDFSRISFLLGKNYHISISPDGLKLKINENTSDSKIDGYCMDSILEVKEYISYIKKKSYSPPITYSPSIIGFLYTKYSKTKMVDFILIVLNLFANFFQIDTISRDFLDYFYKIFSSFTLSQFFE